MSKVWNKPDHDVTDTVPGRTFFGWRCAECDGPVRLNDAAAAVLTGHYDSRVDGPPAFLHDGKSEFYWSES